MITREKLEYVLQFAGPNTDDLGIKDEESYLAPTDEELESIISIKEEKHCKICMA